MDEKTISTLIIDEETGINKSIALETIMEKLYFENYNFCDIKDNLDAALKKIGDHQSFFHTFCDSIKKFTEV